MYRSAKSLVVSVAAALVAILLALPAPVRAAPDEDERLQDFIEVLQDQSKPIDDRIKAASELLPFGAKAKAALPALRRVLKERNSIPGNAWGFEQIPITKTVVKYGGCIEVKTIGHRKVPRPMGDMGLTLRRSVVKVLKVLGPEARTAVPDVIQALQGLPDDKYEDYAGQHVALCRELVEVLGEIGRAAGDAVPVLLEVAKGKVESRKPAAVSFACDSASRVAAVQVLHRFWQQDVRRGREVRKTLRRLELGSDHAVAAAAKGLAISPPPPLPPPPPPKDAGAKLVRDRKILLDTITYCKEQIAKLEKDAQALDAKAKQAAADKMLTAAANFRATAQACRDTIKGFEKDLREAEAKLAKLAK